VPDDELKEACEYLSLRLDMLRNEFMDLEYLDVIRPVSKVSLRKQVIGPEADDPRSAGKQWRTVSESARTTMSVRSDCSKFPTTSSVCSRDSWKNLALELARPGSDPIRQPLLIRCVGV